MPNPPSRLELPMRTLPSNVLTALLITLARVDAAVVVRQRASIPLNHTLASAWSAAKLRRCRALLAAGHTPPPVRVTQYQLNADTWYVVGDGNHRTVAAREAGHSHIDAIIGSRAVCHPHAFRVDAARRLLFQRGGQSECVLVAAELDSAFIRALRQAGVAATTG